MAQRRDGEEISKVLGEPIGFAIPDAALKNRRNLFLSSVVVLVLIFGKIEPSDQVALFGLTLEGVTSPKMMFGLAIVLAYNFITYMWHCYEFYSEWVIRLTGTRLAFVTGAKGGSVGADYPDDPRQSTLYSWWLQEARSLTAYEKLIDRVESSVDSLNGRIDDLQKVDLTSAGTISSSIQSVKNAVEQARYSLEGTRAVVTSDRVPESLKRFDNRFKLLLQSQNMRVVLVDFLVPLLVSMIAVWQLTVFFRSAL